MEPKPAASILRKALSICARWASGTAVLFLRTHHFFTFFLYSAWHQVLGDQPKMSQGMDTSSQASHLWLQFGQKHLSGPRRPTSHGVPWLAAGPPVSSCVAPPTWSPGRGLRRRRQRACADSHRRAWLSNCQATGRFCGDNSGPGLRNCSLMWSGYFVNIFQPESNE